MWISRKEFEDLKRRVDIVEMDCRSIRRNFELSGIEPLIVRVDDSGWGPARLKDLLQGLFNYLNISPQLLNQSPENIVFKKSRKKE